MKVKPTQCVRWQCPHCGSTNYSDLAPAELNQEERAELDAEGIPRSVQWQSTPAFCDCANCGQEVELDGGDEQ